MNFLIILTLIVCLGLLYPGQSARDGSEPYTVDIESSSDKNLTTFQGYFTNNSTDPVNFIYRFTLQKRGTSGQSTTSQGGRIEADPDETVTLSRVQINLTEGDVFTAKLQIFDGQEVVAEKVIESSPD